MSYNQNCMFTRLICESESRSVVSDSLWPYGLYGPWNSPGWNAGVDSHYLLQGIFPTQRSNPGLLHCKQVLYQLSHKGSPRLIYNSSIFSFSFKKEVTRSNKKLLKNIWGFFTCHIVANFLEAQSAKNPPAMQETQVPSLCWEDPLEKEMATHSCILAWKIPDRGAWSATVLGVARVEHNWQWGNPHCHIVADWLPRKQILRWDCSAGVFLILKGMLWGSLLVEGMGQGRIWQRIWTRMALLGYALLG